MVDTLSSVDWSFKAFEEVLKKLNTKHTPTSKRLAILPKFVPQEKAKHIFLTYSMNQVSLAVFITFTNYIIYISTMSKFLKPEAEYSQLCNQFNKINSQWENFSLLLVPSIAKSGAEANKLNESYENCNILLISRIIYLPSYEKIKTKLADEIWTTLLTGIDVFIRNYTFFKEAKESLYLLKFGDTKNIDVRKAHALLKEGIKALGFENIKDSNENGKFILLIAINDTGDSSEKWGTFPVVFETKSGVIEIRLVFSIDAKVVTFDQGEHYDAIIEFISLVNSELKCGQFFIDFKRWQVGIKLSFCYIGYEEKSIISIPQEMISSTISSYKSYGRGLHKIYYEKSRLDIKELFNFCKKRYMHKTFTRFVIDGDTEDERERKNAKYIEKIWNFGNVEEYNREKKIYAAIVKQDFLRDAIEGNQAVFDDSSKTVKYRFIDPVPLPEAVRRKSNFKVEGMIEMLFNELYTAKLTFIKEPYRYLGTFMKTLKIKPDSPLQSLFGKRPHKEDIVQYLGKWFTSFADYLQHELENNSYYLTDIDYINIEYSGPPVIARNEEEDIKTLECTIFVAELREMNNRREYFDLYIKYTATQHDNINMCYGICKYRNKQYLVVQYQELFLFKLSQEIKQDMFLIIDIIELLSKVKSYCTAKNQNLQSITPYLVKINKKTYMFVLDYCLFDEIPVSWKAPEEITNQYCNEPKSFAFNVSLFIYYLLKGKNFYEEIASEELKNDYIDSKIMSREMKQKLKDEAICNIIKNKMDCKILLNVDEKLEYQNPEVVDLMRECFKFNPNYRPSHVLILARIKEMRSLLFTKEDRTNTAPVEVWKEKLKEFVTQILNEPDNT
ncbi:unnamed protein product [Blepharisma stoltei]|uniref:Protein kinase domain-containing protein n=1 Tax=Blepharisma stoltei TaxID=1481888 RepID=A0AAU9JUY3_9CILI|nr:unnamed protein product [Blepharisma stoltei]